MFWSCIPAFRAETFRSKFSLSKSLRFGLLGDPQTSAHCRIVKSKMLKSRDTLSEDRPMRCNVVEKIMFGVRREEHGMQVYEIGNSGVFCSTLNKHALNFGPQI